MNNIYRLSAQIFDRKEPYVDPKRVVWLSVEGTRTEVQYFTFLDRYKEKAGIDSAIIISPLKRKDTKSDPSSVLDLLDEYVYQRDISILDQVKSLSNLGITMGIEKIELYLENSMQLNFKDRELIKKTIEKSKYDVEYHRFLDKLRTDYDIFAIVIDTEGKDNESRANISNVISDCLEKEYKCFLSNPCFEFFLLLHTYNPIEEYEKNPAKFIYNPVISKTHTYVSKLVSNHHGHSKKMSEKKFLEIYLENIPVALRNSKNWAYNLEDVKNNVGTNMIDFFELLKL